MKLDVEKSRNFAIATLTALVWSGLAFCGEIHDAARDGDLEKVKALLKDNPNLVSSKDASGYSRSTNYYAGTNSSFASRLEVMRLQELIASGGGITNGSIKDSNSLSAELHFSIQTNGLNATPLHWAAGDGHKEVAALLLANKADVNAKDKEGWTPLLWAVRKGHKDVVQLLLASNADVNAEVILGSRYLLKTPLFLAVENGDEDMAKVLLKNNAEVNPKVGLNPPLYMAARAGRKNLVELLIAHKADVNRQGFWGTPLSCVADASPFFSNRIGFPDQKDLANRMDIARLLLANQADVNAGRAWMKPLNFAARSGFTEMAKLLLANGADINDKNPEGTTPLHFAASCYAPNHVASLQFLLDKTAGVNAKNANGETPLHWAARAGLKDTVETLWAHQAEMNAKDNKGETPLTWALKAKHAEVAEYLRQHGGQEAAVKTEPETQDKTVRVVYLVSQDRQTRPDFQQALDKAIRELQQWYGQQLNGPTFKLHDPVVEVAHASQDANWFYSHTNGNNQDDWGFNNTLAEANRLLETKFNDPHYVWVIYSDGPGNKGRGTSGVCCLPEDDLLGLVGQHPTQKKPARWVGGLGHELGHAFGLPHPADTKKDADAIMWAGFYDQFPGKAYLTESDKKILLRSAFFFDTAANPVSGNEVFSEKYTYPGGYFGKLVGKSPAQWKEGNTDSSAAFYFDELKRDENIIQLKDTSRGFTIELPVEGGQSRLSTDDEATWHDLYQIKRN